MRKLIRNVAVVAAAVAALASGAASAQAATTLTSGTLTGPDGLPTAGQVRFYAWPHSKRAMTLPLLGTAYTELDGRFTGIADDSVQLLRLSRQRRGWLDITAVADAATGEQGEWTFTVFVQRSGGSVRALSPAAVDSGVASVAAAAPQIRVRALRRPQLDAAAARAGTCQIKRQVQPKQVTRAPTVIGEFNNAYNDGTSGSFDYGRERTADTDIGIGQSFDGGGNWSISGTTHIGDSGTVEFPTVRRRYSRKLRTEFEYSREAARNDTCAKWYIEIRATSWIGGGDDSIKPHGLDACIPSALGLGFPSGYGFVRNRNKAVRYNRGVSVFGITLTTESGFSEDVVLRYHFRGRRGKRHYLCGPDGQQSPYESGRVFSGARR